MCPQHHPKNKRSKITSSTSSERYTLLREQLKHLQMKDHLPLEEEKEHHQPTNLKQYTRLQEQAQRIQERMRKLLE